MSFVPINFVTDLNEARLLDWEWTGGTDEPVRLTLNVTGTAPVAAVAIHIDRADVAGFRRAFDINFCKRCGEPLK